MTTPMERGAERARRDLANPARSYSRGLTRPGEGRSANENNNENENENAGADA